MRKILVVVLLIAITLPLVSARWAWLGCAATKEYPVSTRIVASKDIGEDNGALMYRLKSTDGIIIEVTRLKWDQAESGKEFEHREWARIAEAVERRAKNLTLAAIKQDEETIRKNLRQ
jgi:hypothetical protein